MDVQLGWQAWLTVGVIITTLGLLLWERWTPDRILIGAVVVLVASGVLTPLRAVSGFWNPGLLAIAVLFVLVAALKSTGAIRWIGQWVLGRSRDPFLALVRVTGISATLSAFINNTPVVAMFTSAVEHWSRRSGVSASKLLLPMNYATVLGGMCTLIGTSTNLIVAGLVIQAGLPALSLFDPIWVGFPAMLAGVVYLTTIGHRLLPERRSAIDQATDDTREYAVEMLVEAQGPLVGRSVGDASLRHLFGSYLIELDRDGEVMAAVAPETVLRANDRLVFVGIVDAVRELRRIDGLRPATDQLFKLDATGAQRTLVELVLSRFSPVIGKTLREASFRQRYSAAVIAISRAGRRLHDKPGDVVLQAGDTLLVETLPSFLGEHRNSPDFLLVNLIDGDEPVQRRRAITSIVVLVAMILANVLLDVDILHSALAAAVVVVAAGCVSLVELRRSFDLRLLVVIACSFALGAAIDVTGVADAVAAHFGGWTAADPFWTLVVVYLVTVASTELLTNNASAVLMFPIALSSAELLGVSPMPFIMAVMMGASAGFMTPIGYQTNLMVYGPGGYRFTDYLRLGAPLSLVVGVAVLWAITRFWAF